MAPPKVTRLRRLALVRPGFARHPPDIPLPSGWARNVKSAVLHVISLAHHAIVAARGWAANSINVRAGLAADNDRLNQEPQLFREELRIRDVRLARIDR